MARTSRASGSQGGQSTTVRVPLAGHTMYRNTSLNKDQRFLNCYQESVKDELADKKKSFVVKRPGLTSNHSTETATARGLTYFNGKFYAVVGNSLYENDVDIYTLATSSGPVGFESFDSEGLNYLFLCDGTDGYVIDTSSVVTKVNVTYSAWQASTNYALGDKRIPTVDNGYYYEVTADSGSSGGSEPTWPTAIGSTVVDSGITWTCAGSYGGFPSPHIPTPQYIDGYMLLPRSGSADVHNSDVENVFGWGSGNFFTAEMWPDNVVSLIRQNNMLITLGSYSGEFFYDAAQTGGSPFQRNESAALQMGCVAPYAVFEEEKFCVFVGQSRTGGRAIWLIEGFQPKKISNEFIERILDAEGTNLASATGYGLRTAGHLFYVLNLTNTTLVYDIEEKVWHEWRTGTGAFEYWFMTDKEDGYPYLLHKSSGAVVKMSPTVYQDVSADINVDIYTNLVDFDTMNRKFMHNMTVVCDQQANDSITVYWTDDDYSTWSSGKTLSRDSRAFFSRCGAFRRRAFRIAHTGNYPFRAESIEAEVDLGFS